ncbi:type I DNA topoisomerase [Kiritimatiella glycovorans]|uniref:DNA topoisomerase 1 n=1 Tax=Kiritimatiella glycovorans TaxID=1307763 RepID=A0A0G3ECB9_9BACT|nr:type I DNA topoisomerase [Kiritimatiella glycovorans]AKJ64156.1 DNA topoisomerase 1 [Kiritimatiella glycovorans]
MSKYLVIVESPAKAKKIGQILGPEYTVKASMGHVRDLPEKRLGVRVQDRYQPDYVSTGRGKKVLADLKKAAGQSEAVYLAPDPDREGEAIAWHLYEEMKDAVPEDRFYRVAYNEITPAAIRKAFGNPGRIDMNRVNSQQARRVIDRLVGFKGSPVVSRSLRGASSVGRVQTVALRLVVSREEQIRAFTPETYWLLGAEVRRVEEPLDPFRVRLHKIDEDPVGVKDRMLQKGAIRTKEQLDAVCADLDRADWRVAEIKEREVRKRPRPPFITSTLQQAASNVLSFNPGRTMRVAQRLYEAGLITYMRTDSVAVAQSAREECRAYIEQTWGKEYRPDKPNAYRSRGSAQEAHEAIRPTETGVTADSLGDAGAEDRKLYDLIWRRFVASQMSPARIAQKTVDIAVSGEHDYLFRASASDVLFPGYMKATGIEKNKSDDQNGDAEKPLPPLAQGDGLERLDWVTEEKQTQPPARYTEASLIRAMEENGVGRPSTYAAIIEKLDERNYVGREKRSLIPTEVGEKLIHLVRQTAEKLEKQNQIDLFEVNFTADMEDKLDRVEEGEVEWTEMLDRFYPSLTEWIAEARGRVEPERVRPYLEALEHVSQWNPPVKRGRRTYDDAQTVKDMRERVEQGEEFTDRQFEMLHRMACRYIDQIPQSFVDQLGLEAPEKPRDETRRKIELLSGVEFEAPREVGKRTFDDEKFHRSLASQVEQGKRLSDRQIAALDRMLRKYRDQIPDWEKEKTALGLDEKEEGANGETAQRILDLFQSVSEWAEPQKRGKRTFDDQSFYGSLRDHLKSRGALSDRQLAALKKMAARYAAQIPDYEQKQQELDLPPPRKTRTPKKK